MKIKRALIIGASGLVGSHLLNLLLADESYQQVTVLVRRPLPVNHSRCRVVTIDFDNKSTWLDYVKADDLFCCLGTTMKQARTKDKFFKVDFEYTLAIARQAVETGATRCFLVSALGADARSSVFYNRVKGEIENALSKLPFKALHIFRPSLLLGNRQDNRPIEAIATKLSGILSGLMMGPLRPYRPIQASHVALAMQRAAGTDDGQGTIVHSSMEIEKYLKEKK
jgi:uncharacterized protein YbjT (DUF2867 family)